MRYHPIIIRDRAGNVVGNLVFDLQAKPGAGVEIEAFDPDHRTGAHVMEPHDDANLGHRFVGRCRR